MKTSIDSPSFFLNHASDMTLARSVAYGGLCLVAVVVTLVSWRVTLHGQTPSYSEQESGPLDVEAFSLEPLFVDPYANWVRPDGPRRVGIQVGHWQASEAPDEQEQLRMNTGASAAGTTEWESNLVVAKKLKTLLEADGIVVDVLPVTIPPDYLADAFISLHSDGNLDTSVSGFKISPPWRDRSGNAELLSSLLVETYGEATKLAIDPNITQNMRGYYAFNWRKYEHSIHPMTPAAIVETGFLTNAGDRRVIVAKPDLVAEALAEGIRTFLDASLKEEIEA